LRPLGFFVLFLLSGRLDADRSSPVQDAAAIKPHIRRLVTALVQVVPHLRIDHCRCAMPLAL